MEQALADSDASVRAELHGKVIQISAAPILSENAVSGAAVVFFDITKQEKAEQQRREFTSNVSHELKTPLHSISGYSELLERGITAPEDVQPFAEKIYVETHRLIALVEDIISLSHMDEGGKDLTFTEVDLCEKAEIVVESLRDMAAEKLGLQFKLMINEQQLM